MSMNSSEVRLLGNNGIREGPRSFTNRKSLISLIVGLIVGFCMAELFLSSSSEKYTWVAYTGQPYDDIYDMHQSNQTLNLSRSEAVFGSHIHENENSSLAIQLYNEVKVLCWVMTDPENHQTKAIHVKATWAKRCNKVLFMSSEEDSELGSIALPVEEGRANLWGKTKEAFKYIYANHLDEADWFLKADDDTYIIVENLRYMLYPYSPENPIYFGCRYKPFAKQGYMSGGAGYVLSKEALRRMVEDGLTNETLCRNETLGEEDVEMGVCLENVGVIAGDSRDNHGRGRFFPFVPEDHLLATRNNDYWYWKYIYYETDEGLNCCSDYTISFHYIEPNRMYVFEYLIYHLRPYGIDFTSDPLPDKIVDKEKT